MKVLHVYPESDELIQRHVMMLTNGLRQSCTVFTAGNHASARQQLKDIQPDIVHVHGCSQFFLLHTLHSADKAGIRAVVTLHGQLEPWVMQQQNAQDKAGRLLLLKNAISNAYAVITLGRLERQNFEKIGWNRRTEEIHNAVITNATTPQEMATLTFTVYQKVMDSNTLEQMDEVSTQALAAILKAGILGDRRWVSEMPQTSPDWRRLLIYAEQENIRNYVDYGINILGLQTPMLDTSKINAYFPDNYLKPKPLKEVVGEYQGDENEYILRIIRQIERKPLLLHLIELTRELYRDNVNDEKLCEMLEEKSLSGFAARLMQVLSEQVLLDEGFMPLDPIDDKQTEHLRKLLTNHLKT